MFGKKITTTAVLVKEIARLNRRVNILVDNISYPQYIKVDCDPKKLRLPKPFYYNEKNGITNKHKTTTGAYISLDVVW